MCVECEHTHTRTPMHTCTCTHTRTCTHTHTHTHAHIVVQLSRVWLSVTPWTIAHQAPLSLTISWSSLKFTLIELVMLSNHLIIGRPLLFCLLSFPASGSFPVSWLFTSGGQSIGISGISVLLKNIQGWFPLGWTGWISLQSKGLSRVSSSTTVQKHQFLDAQPFSSMHTHTQIYRVTHTHTYIYIYISIFTYL